MKLKYSVRFYLEKRNREYKNPETRITENVPIFLFFTFDGKRLQYYSGYRIDADKWNPAKKDFPGNVKANNFNKDGISAREINSHLIKLQSLVEDIYRKAKVNDLNPSVDYIREELKKQLNEGGKDNGAGFFDVFQKFVDIEGRVNTWTKGTYTKFETIKKHLQAFQENTRKKIEFATLDEKFFSKWIEFQLKSADEGGLGHRNTYIKKNEKILKWFLRWATRNGYNKNTYFEKFNPDLKGTARNNKIIYLTWYELMNLYGLDIPKKFLDQVRDVFCFCCFTGLRYSDVYNLKRSNIKGNTIEFTTIKTDEVLIIDLNDYSWQILHKYADFHFQDDKLLPVISNQKMNEYLKELGQFAKMNQPESVVYFRGSERVEKTYQKWELLSTHVGRKTFITNALFLNIPAEVIMSWTGHKDHKTMENYYMIVSQHKQREMKKFNSNE